MQIKNYLLLPAIIITTLLRAQQPRSFTASELLLQVRKLNTVGSVLYIAAHPDDENTRLLSYLANEKCLRTAYLSLTRGDGGQNLIGPEQGTELGIIRTQELLAARSIDGAEQFFTRAYDFGYSKTVDETFRKWNHDSVLADVVWVIRNFKPDIIITRFATDGSGGHGHHTASAIIAEEAFDAAADPTRFTSQLQYVQPWQAKRLVYNSTARFRDPNADMSGLLKLDVGGYNVLVGKSYGEIAAESRSMHKSQGFGSARQRGQYFEYFKPLKGDISGIRSIFDRVDFSWKRLKGGDKVGKVLQECISEFSVERPEASVELLLDAIKASAKVSTTNASFLNHWRQQMNETILRCAGVYVEVQTKVFTAIDSVNYFVLSLKRRPGSVAVLKWTPQVVSAKGDTAPGYVAVPLPDDMTDTVVFAAKANGPVSQPYWLQRPPDEGLFYVSDQRLIGKAENNNNEVKCSFAFGKDTVAVWRTPQFKWVEPDRGEIYRQMVVSPPALIEVSDPMILFTDRQPKKLKVTVRSASDKPVKGRLYVEYPSGWTINAPGATVIVPNVYSANDTVFSELFADDFSLAKKNDADTREFTITPSDSQITSKIHCRIRIDSVEYNKSIHEIKYDHIPVQTIFPAAETKLVYLTVNKKLKRIGYIPGAGDDIPSALTQLGYDVTTLSNDMLAKESLQSLDAIVTGVRAFNVNDELTGYKQRLLDYVRNGGNLVVQYNTNSFAGPFKGDIGPYPFKITRDRVTDEKAKVNFEIPDHAVLNTPNKITPKDFDNWVQERGIYFAGDVSPEYAMPLSMADPGEAANRGALIVGKYGKGNFIYTGLDFFRELPAGVPGAYRLFVNLLETGK